MSSVNPDHNRTADDVASSYQEAVFRETVRDILGLPWDTRNFAIYDELRRLKRQDQNHLTIAASAPTPGMAVGKIE